MQRSANRTRSKTASVATQKSHVAPKATRALSTSTRLTNKSKRLQTSFNRKMSTKRTVHDVLDTFGIKDGQNGVQIGQEYFPAHGKKQPIVNPATGEKIIDVTLANAADYAEHVGKLDSLRQKWAATPTPVRGEIVRQIGDELRRHKEDLAIIISSEMGKIYPESLGEIQEGIDICDYAVGLSRQISGSVLPSERPDHFMMERYKPLKGDVAVITAFNFPAAVYFWNIALSLVCGNTQVFKPHPTGSLIGLACHKLVADVLAKNGFAGISAIFLGDADVGAAITENPKSALVSFTGSTKVGREIAKTVAGRFGNHILELGGNNATFIFPDADIDMAVRSSLFGAVGTAGQRCTSLRRLYIHEDVYDNVVSRLVDAYKSVPIGNPLEPGVLCGPLHTQAQIQQFENTLGLVPKQGGKVLYGGSRVEGKGNFVVPAIAEMPTTAQLVQEELFAPLLYVMKFKTLSEAIELNNSVEQGLSSSIFTQNQSAIFHWTGPNGSDCGIANVNIGTSGAEIGGAFGGNKATGGGRESGSDAWKQYCLRQTITINYSKELPLAQGIVFGSNDTTEKKVQDPAYDM